MVELRLPLPPNRANARGSHWASTHQSRTVYYQWCLVEIQNQRSRWRDAVFAFPVAISGTLYVRNLMDPDNVVARVKWPIDCLVIAGVLPGDTRSYVETPVLAQEIDRLDPRFALRLTSAGEAAVK